MAQLKRSSSEHQNCFSQAYTALFGSAVRLANRKGLGEDFVDFVLETRLMSVRIVSNQCDAADNFPSFISKVVSKNVRWAYYDFLKHRSVTQRAVNYASSLNTYPTNNEESPFGIDSREALEQIYRLSRRRSPLGRNVRQLLEHAKGYTLDELALKYGYKSRSSILKHTQEARQHLRKAFSEVDTSARVGLETPAPFRCSNPSELDCPSQGPFMPQKIVKLPVRDILAQFLATLPRANNYPFVIGNYLDYLLEHDLLINEQSANHYFDHYAQTRKLSSTIQSPVRKFVGFAKQQQVQGVLPSPPAPNFPHRYQSLYQGYLASASFPSSSKSQATYRSVLLQLFTWLEGTDNLLNHDSITQYVSYLQEAGRSKGLIRLVVSVIKQLVRFVVLHSDPDTLGINEQERLTLFSVQYLSPPR